MTQIIISVRESESRHLNRLRLRLPTPGSLPRLRRLRLRLRLRLRNPDPDDVIGQIDDVILVSFHAQVNGESASTTFMQK